MTKLKAVKSCLNYLLESEEEDFNLNCVAEFSDLDFIEFRDHCEKHVYGQAYLALYGHREFCSMIIRKLGENNAKQI